MDSALLRDASLQIEMTRTACVDDSQKDPSEAPTSTETNVSVQETQQTEKTSSQEKKTLKSRHPPRGGSMVPARISRRPLAAKKTIVKKKGPTQTRRKPSRLALQRHIAFVQRKRVSSRCSLLKQVLIQEEFEDKFVQLSANDVCDSDSEEETLPSEYDDDYYDDDDDDEKDSDDDEDKENKPVKKNHDDDDDEYRFLRKSRPSILNCIR